MQSTIENRMFPRVKIKWFVEVRTAQSSMEGVTQNVSPSGVFVRCKNPPRPNEVLDMSIRIPDAERPLTAEAEVVWSNMYGPDDEITPRGMGVRFLNIENEDQQCIAKAIANRSLEKIASDYLQNLEREVRKNRSGHPLKLPG